MKLKLIIILSLLALFTILIIFSRLYTSTSQNPPTPLTNLTIGSTTIQVETRRTTAEQTLGLSYRPSLPPDQGMIFIYDRPQPVGYWMKGMNFPLDFIWVRQGKVVEIHENIPNPTLLNPAVRTISPLETVDLVLEVNAGFIKKHHLKVGDEVKY